MKNFNMVKRVLSFVTCSALSISLISAFPSTVKDGKSASAKTIDEIHAEKEANDAKIADLEKKIGSIEGNKKKEAEFQSVLTEQIGVIQDNITLLDTELDQINADILLTQDNIALLEVSIQNQEDAIKDKVELFKSRLCNLYISGNDTLATVLIGTSSFYDMLSRVEMVNRIASADQELIDELLGEIQQMEQTKSDLEIEKQTLQARLDDQEARKQDKASEMSVLYDKMAQTQCEIDRLANEQNMLHMSQEELEEANKALEAEEEKINEAISKSAEEAQRRYEEEKRRLLEEAKRKAAEEEAARKAAEEESARKSAEEAAAKKAAEEAAARKSAEEAAAKKAAEEAAAKKAAEEEAARKAAEKRAAEEAAAQQNNYAEPVYTTTKAVVTQAPIVTTIPPTTAAPVVTTTITYADPLAALDTFIWPAPGFRYISSPFGWRELGGSEFHKGIDIGDYGIGGNYAVASRPGKVIEITNDCPHDTPSICCNCGGGYGNHVVIQHDGTYTTLYGHLRSTLVSNGQYVQQGEPVGIIGCTGQSTGDHLHFEVRVNKVCQNPLDYVNP
ncbi:MAG: peptidoglycan DD-metalloendopeptidase family protein [Ruminococcus sp.]|nr:peptidoglycan DD-metalloendopeptidase family protein [Ruminococcus sp.]